VKTDYDTETVMVPVRSIRAGESPRLAGEDSGHTRMLAQIAAELPPILVHRASMQVIDGMHRLRAATANRQELIRARFFDGSWDEAFVLAVAENVAHGLPLSLTDRRAAARRILQIHPDWSDRAVAAVTGISPGTVAALRKGDDVDSRTAPERIGRDGRIRPLSSAVGRRIAGQILENSPRAPLRDVARAAGVSVATAHDVRQRIQRGESPVPARQVEKDQPQLGTGSGAGRRGASPMKPGDREELIDGLRRDPSLKFSESGRTLLRWLLPQAAGTGGWRKAVGGAVPPHSTYLVARLARACAEEWLEFASQIEDRLADSPGSRPATRQT
jgi:hypothetical protein